MLTPAQEEIIKNILAPFEPEEIGVFGSYARGDQHSDSDLDILVTFGKRLTLLDLVGLEIELSERLGIKVDLVTRKALSPLILPFVEKDLKMIA
ncbi:MAG: nucleotidyltransferase family protein [Saprospiraceae bacterium]|nr:nucleotidyltransferase family protein [Saprospiraceae bacterium]